MEGEGDEDPDFLYTIYWKIFVFLFVWWHSMVLKFLKNINKKAVAAKHNITHWKLSIGDDHMCF